MYLIKLIYYSLSVSYIINNTPKAITTPSQSSSKEETYNNMFVISNIDNVSDGIYADNTPIEIINNEIKHNNAHECDCKSRKYFDVVYYLIFLD